VIVYFNAINSGTQGLHNLWRARF